MAQRELLSLIVDYGGRLGRALEPGGRTQTLARRLYAFGLVAMAGRTGIPWSVNGVACRIDPRERSRIPKEYEAAVAVYLRPRVRSDAVCFDIGANVGAYVIQLAAWSSPGGKVIAFEPNARARATLRHHIALNHLDDRVHVEALAVGRTSGTELLYTTGADGMARLGKPNLQLPTATSASTAVTTLDQYCLDAGYTGLHRPL